MKILILAFLCGQLLTFQLAQAETAQPVPVNSKKPIKDKSLREEMNKISQKIRELGPLIASEVEFSKTTNKNLLLKSINELHTRFKNLKKHPTIEMSGLAINQVIMSEEMKDVVHLIEQNKPVQGRAKLLSTLNLCVSCHSQSPGMKSPKLFTDADITKFKISNFENESLKVSITKKLISGYIRFNSLISSVINSTFL